MQITLMSYNIKTGLWTEEGLEAVARVIAAVGPDVVCLQEVDRFMQRTGQVDQAEWLGQRLGYQAIFGPATAGEEFGAPGGEYGNAALSCWPIMETELRLLYRPSFPPDQHPPYYAEQRAALRCLIDVRGTPINVFCTHFGLTDEQRLVQARQVAEFCAQWHPHGPVVLMGDFNALPDSPEIAILRSGLIDVFEQRGITGDERLTFPSGPLGSRTDDGW